MNRKQTDKWNEIRAVLYTAAVVMGSLGTSTLVSATDEFTLMKGMLFVVICFCAIILARYVVPPEGDKNV